MNRNKAFFLFVFLASTTPLAAQGTAGAPWDSVARILGSATNINAGTYRYNFPRSDLAVTVNGVAIMPAFALVSWVGFGVVGADTVAMGDIVTTSSEYGDVVKQLHTAGVSISAIHNHLVGEMPRVMYIHFMAHGSACDVAMKLKSVIAKTAAPQPVPPARPAAVTIDTSRVFEILGVRGRAVGALAQMSFNFVPEGVVMHGSPVPAPLSTASPVNVQRVAEDRVIATGDFTLKAQQLNGVVDALVAHNVLPTAVHSHLTGETPALYYVHFWADGTYDAVLQGLRSAIEAARK